MSEPDIELIAEVILYSQGIMLLQARVLRYGKTPTHKKNKIIIYYIFMNDHLLITQGFRDAQVIGKKLVDVFRLAQ